MVSIKALEEAGGTVRARRERYDVSFSSGDELEAILEVAENDEYDWDTQIDYQHNSVRIERGSVY